MKINFAETFTGFLGSFGAPKTNLLELQEKLEDRTMLLLECPDAKSVMETLQDTDAALDEISASFSTGLNIKDEATSLDAADVFFQASSASILLDVLPGLLNGTVAPLADGDERYNVVKQLAERIGRARKDCAHIVKRMFERGNSSDLAALQQQLDTNTTIAKIFQATVSMMERSNHEMLMALDEEFGLITHVRDELQGVTVDLALVGAELASGMAEYAELAEIEREIERETSEKLSVLRRRKYDLVLSMGAASSQVNAIAQRTGSAKETADKVLGSMEDRRNTMNHMADLTGRTQKVLGSFSLDPG